MSVAPCMHCLKIHGPEGCLPLFCSMCGHGSHERDCEVLVLKRQIPCGCQFWAEGWGRVIIPVRPKDEDSTLAEQGVAAFVEAESIATLKAEIERLKKLVPPEVGRSEGGVGQGTWSVYAEKMQAERDTAQHFHAVAVKERDYERVRYDRLREAALAFIEKFDRIEPARDEMNALKMLVDPERWKS